MPDGSAQIPQFDPQKDPFRIILPASEMSVRRALQRLCAVLSGDLITPDISGTLELVLAEALNNVVEHAYADGAGIIEVNVSATTHALSISVKDQGTPMPGGQVPLGEIPNYPTDPQELPEGGFGWFLIHDLTDNLSYQRQDECNLLKFDIPLSGSLPVAELP